jgi:AcrR family transcriptional regulator
MGRKRTKEILAESFYKVAATKDVTRIKVNDIIEYCGMSHATFYRYFRDKYDLIAWIYDQDCSAIYEKYRDSSDRMREITAEWIRYCKENREFLINLIDNTSGYDSFFRKMVDHMIRSIEKDIIDIYGENALTEKVHLKIYIHSSGAVRLMCAWLKGHEAAAEEEILEALVESVSEMIMPHIVTSNQ